MKNEYLRIRVNGKLKADIYKEAQSKGMSISEYVRYILRKEVEK